MKLLKNTMMAAIAAAAMLMTVPANAVYDYEQTQFEGTGEWSYSGGILRCTRQIGNPRDYGPTIIASYNLNKQNTDNEGKILPANTAEPDADKWKKNYKKLLSNGDEYIVTTEDGKHGVVSANGEVIIAPSDKYSEIRRFNANRAIAKTGGDKNSHYYIIDGRFNIVYDFKDFEPKFQYPWDGSSFTAIDGEAVIAVKNKNDRYALINSDGKILTEFRYKNIEIASDYIGITYNEGDVYNYGYLFRSNGYKECFNLEEYSYDRGYDGNVIVKKDYSSYLGNYKGKILSDKYVSIDCAGNGRYIAKYWNSGLRALLDNNGNKISAAYDKIEHYGKKFIVYPDRAYNRKGIIDCDGSVIVKPEYEDISYDDLDDAVYYFAYSASADKTDMYSENGKYVMSFQGERKRIYSDSGYFAVENADKKYGFVNRASGKLVIDFIYDNLFGKNETYNLTDNRPVFCAERSGRIYVIDDFGNDLEEKDIMTSDKVYVNNHVQSQRIEETGTDVSRLGGASALVDFDNKRYVIPYSAGLQIKNIGCGEFSYCRDNRQIVVDKNNSYIAEFGADEEIAYLGNDYYVNKTENGCMVIDRSGERVLAECYDKIYNIDEKTFIAVSGYNAYKLTLGKKNNERQ